MAILSRERRVYAGADIDGVSISSIPHIAFIANPESKDGRIVESATSRYKIFSRLIIDTFRRPRNKLPQKLFKQ